MLERIALPLAPYVLITLNSLLCLAFFLCLENEIRLLKRASPRQQPGKDTIVQDLKTKLEDLSERVRDAEERAGIFITPPSPTASLNLNKRTQIIRMSRRGEPAETISASLSVPRKEIELLLKVHSLILDGGPKSAL
jgi:hypothetical protein